MATRQRARTSTWPAGGGEMGASIRAFDWACTSLGPLDAWPPSLRTAVDVCLGLPVASFIWWGRERVQLYNDAALRLVGAEHPAALGAPAGRAWAKGWAAVGPLVEQVTRTAQPVRGANLALDGQRLTWSCSALGAAAGGVAGIFATAIASAAPARSEAFLLRLGDALRQLADPVEVQATAARLLGEHLGASRVTYLAIDGRQPTDSDSLWTRFERGRTDVVEDTLTDPTLTDAQRAVIAGRASIAVQVVQRGRPVAAMVADDRRPRRWTDEDVALVEHTAERTWAAVERARAEGELRRSEQWLRLALQAARMYTWELDVATGTVSFSGDIAAVLGFFEPDPDTYLERVARYALPEDGARHRLALERTIRGEGDLHTVTRVVHPVTSELLWIEVYAALVRGSGGGRPRVVGVALNVTERKRIDEELRRANERFSLAETAANGFIYDWDMVRDSVTRSDGLTAVLGYRQDEVPLDGAGWRGLIHPDDVERALAEFSRGTRAGRYELEYRLRHKDGRYVDVLDTGVAIRDEHGGIVRVVGSAVDITARTRTEAALRANEERQAFLLELSDALRPLGEVVDVQEATARLLGAHLKASWAYYGEYDQPTTHMTVRRDYTDGGAPSLSGQHPISSFEMLEQLKRGHTQAIDDMETSPLVSDGTRARFGRLGMRALLAAPIRASDGQLLAALIVADRAVRHWTDLDVALVQDVADRTWAAVERTRTEAALHESEARLRLATEAARIEAWEFDLATDTPPATARQAFEAAAASGTDRFDYEVRSMAADDEVRWLRVSGVLRRDAAGVAVRAVGIAQDITERKQAEAERERLAVTEAVAAERQALLKHIVRAQEEERARVSREIHDSITQLAHAAAIHLDNAVDLLDGTPAPARAAVERGRDLARQAAREARRLIAGLRPETLDTLGLAGAVGQEVDTLRAAGRRVDYEAGDLAGVRLDPEAEITLFRVAQEALSNVRKHAGRARVRVRLQQADGGVRLEVRDWGRGFEPRAGRATSQGEQVGLVGMRERLHLLGGTLEVRSSPASGTTVRASLPIGATTAPRMPSRGRSGRRG